MATAPASVIFEEASHTYRTPAGSVLPSVTQVIKEVLPPGWLADPWYLQRGRALHHGCRLLDEGRLDWSTVHPEIIGRIRAWQDFQNALWVESDWSIIDIEKPLAHPFLAYAGTPDRILSIDGCPVICDLKSSIEPQVKVQLGGYSAMWRESTKRKVKPGVARAVAVELHDDGTFKTLWLNPRELMQAEATFMACLTVFNFIKAKKLESKQCKQQ